MNDVTYEEISLYDIVKVLRKRKKIFWIAFAVVFALGSLLALQPPKKIYEFSQLVNLANYADDSGRVIIVRPVDYVANKMSPNYIPVAVANYNTAHKTNFDAKNIAIDAKPVADTFFNLSVSGSAATQSFYKELFANIISQIKADTNPTIDARKNYFDEYVKYLEDQLKDQEKLNKNILAALADKDGGAISKYFIVTAMQNRSNLLLQVLDRIRDAKTKEKLLHPTKVETDFSVSAKAIGVSKSTLITLSAVIGLIFGFFAVFIREFFARMNGKIN